jgi:RNA polymerase sigma-70 factor (ECF subfamily)
MSFLASRVYLVGESTEEDDHVVVQKSRKVSDPELAGVPSSPTGADVTSLFQQHFARLARSLCFIVLDQETAADIAQDAFLQLHKHWGEVSGYDNPVAWVYRVAVNRAKDHRRRLARALKVQQRLAADYSATDWPQRYVESDFLQQLRGLPMQQRTAAALYYVGDFRIREVADLMGISQGAASSHLHRAREALLPGMKNEVELWT